MGHCGGVGEDGWEQRGRGQSKEMASGGVLVGEQGKGLVYDPRLSVDLHPRNYHLNLSVCL